MAVSRCLNFWKSEYITVINASASERPMETLPVEGECLPAGTKKMMDLRGKTHPELGCPAWPGRGSLPWAPVFGHFCFGNSAVVLIRGQDGAVHSWEDSLAYWSMICLGEMVKRLAWPFGIGHLPSCDGCFSLKSRLYPPASVSTRSPWYPLAAPWGVCCV